MHLVIAWFLVALVSTFTSQPIPIACLSLTSWYLHGPDSHANPGGLVAQLAQSTICSADGQSAILPVLVSPVDKSSAASVTDLACRAGAIVVACSDLKACPCMEGPFPCLR